MHLLMAAALSFAQAPATLKEALKDADLPGRWIYDDIAAGTSEARTSGRPLLIVFR